MSEPSGNSRFPRLMFVCTGNICRSSLAEGYARYALAQQGIIQPDLVASAGTTSCHVGQSPDPRAMAVARERGFDISGQRAQALIPGHFEVFDLLLVATREHEGELLRRAVGEAQRAKIHLLTRFVPAGPWRGQDIPDPYYGDRYAFDFALDMIEIAVDGLLAQCQNG